MKSKWWYTETNPNFFLRGKHDDQNTYSRCVDQQQPSRCGRALPAQRQQEDHLRSTSTRSVAIKKEAATPHEKSGLKQDGMATKVWFV